MSQLSASQFKVVDAHHHLWDLDALYYPWLTDHISTNFVLGEYSDLRRNYLPEDYLRDSARQNVVRTVHVEADLHADDPMKETNWVVGIHERYGFPNAIVAHAFLDRDDTDDRLAELAACSMVRGIRSKPVTSAGPSESITGQPGTMQDDRWLKGLALFEKYGLSWDMRIPYWHLAEGAEVARALPGVSMIVNHAGLPWDRSEAGLAIWRNGMEALAACPNVTVKMSMLCLRDAPWNFGDNCRIVRETVDIFGVDRCMFASNFPVDRLRIGFDDMFADYRKMVDHLPVADQQKLFADNAMRVYRLEP
jgi:predicted TIM-barrel fold metal-dependent hydrolase